MADKTLRKRFDLPTIQSATGTAKGEFELDKFTQRITGILLTSDRDEQLFHRGTIEVTLSGEEIVPDGYHAKLLMSGLGVAPKDRFLPLDLPPGNGMVKITYTDTINAGATFSPYQVFVYLETEIIKDGVD